MEGSTQSLNTAQRRRLAIYLAFVERDVHRLCDAIERPPGDLLLTRYSDPILASIVPKLQVAATGACGACHLQLPPSDLWCVREATNQLVTCPYCGCFLYDSNQQEKTHETQRGCS